MKINLKMSFLVGLFLLFSVIACHSQDKLAKKTVDDFLNDWLIKKDIKLVQKYLDKNLFSNKFLFSESCLGVPKEAPIFLEEVIKGLYEDEIKNVLTLDELEPFGFNFWFDKTRLLSNPIEDKYFLKKVLAKDLLKPFSNEKDVNYQNLSYIKQHLPSKDYLFLGTLVKVEVEKEKVEAPIYFIWRREKQVWKIIQFGMECQ